MPWIWWKAKTCAHLEPVAPTCGCRSSGRGVYAMKEAARGLAYAHAFGNANWGTRREHPQRDVYLLRRKSRCWIWAGAHGTAPAAHQNRALCTKTAISGPSGGRAEMTTHGRVRAGNWVWFSCITGHRLFERAREKC
jgi:hypothetical protein